MFLLELLNRFGKFRSNNGTFISPTQSPFVITQGNKVLLIHFLRTIIFPLVSGQCFSLSLVSKQDCFEKCSFVFFKTLILSVGSSSLRCLGVSLRWLLLLLSVGSRLCGLQSLMCVLSTGSRHGLSSCGTRAKLL